MNKTFVLMIILLATCSFAIAQTKDEAAVAAAIEKLRMAMINADKSELERIAAEKLSYGHSSGLVEDKSAFVDKIVSGKSDFVTIDLTDQAISISGTTAVVRHKFNASINDNGKPGEVHLSVLLIFQLQGKEWKLLARQAVKLAP